MSIVINIGMWFERFVIIVTSLHRDFLPSSWGYFTPTMWDVLCLLGSFGLFFTMFCLFVRFLPMVATAEVKTVLPQADPHWQAGPEHEVAAHASADARRRGRPASRPTARSGSRWSFQMPLVPRLPKGPYYGVLGEFATPADLYHACERVRDAGFTRWDAHSPFPVHGLERAMGLRRSPLPWIVLVMGLTGAALGFVLQWWVHTSAYPLVISGKPFFTWPAFIPITFEVAVLFGALGAVFGMLGLNRLPMHHHPLFQSKVFERVDRRRLLHLDRIVGSAVRSVGHRDAAEVPGRTKRRAPGVLNDPRTRSRALRPEQATIPPGHAWNRLPVIGAVFAVLGAVACAILGAANPKQFFFSWLVSFLFFLSLALGALFFVLIQYATQGGWGIVLRRIGETIFATLPVMAALFVPVLLGLHDLYEWSHAEAVEHDALLRWKAPYLNVPFFLIRAALYFGIWSFIAILYYRGSRGQDATGRSRGVGPPAPPRRARHHRPRAHPDLRLDRLDHVADAALVLDHVRRLFLRRLLRRVHRAALGRRGGDARRGAAGHGHQRRAPARRRQAPLRLHGVLGLYRLLAVLPDVVREHPGGDDLVQGADGRVLDDGLGLPHGGTFRGSVLLPDGARRQAEGRDPGHRAARGSSPCTSSISTGRSCRRSIPRGSVRRCSTSPRSWPSAGASWRRRAG